jgi:glycine cleavage system H protein
VGTDDDETIYRGCVLPANLYYAVDADVWVRLEGDGQVTLGMTDPAQTRCGRMVHIAFKRVGRQIDRGQSVATVESGKWVGPVPSPITGELLATNQAAFDRDILVANRDPYGAGWLVRLRPRDLATDLAGMRTGVDAIDLYRRRIDEMEVRCFRCED